MSINFDKRFRTELNKHYKDGIVKRLSIDHGGLYQQIHEYLTDKDINIIDYIISLGFDYEGRSKRYNSQNEIVDALIEHYPDKNIGLLGIFSRKYPYLYQCVRNYIKDNEPKGVTQQTFLERNGFIVELKKGAKTNILYDLITLNELKRNYDFSDTEFANFVNTSRNNINLLFKRKGHKLKEPIWQNQELDNSEIEICKQLISSYLYKFSSDRKIHIRIYKHSNNISQHAILSINNDKVKCTFNAPDIIINTLKEYRYDQLFLNEIDIIRTIKSGEGVTVNGNILNIIDDSLYQRIFKALRLRNSTLNTSMLKNEYIKMLTGCKTQDNRIISDYEIKNILSKYILDDGITVKIPFYNDDGSKNPDYHRITRLRQSRKFDSIKQFINAFGFKYVNFRNVNILKKYKEVISSNYSVDSNRIYISSNDPFYNALYSYFNNHKDLYSDFDSLINSLGFIRINKEDLPGDYVIYDWQNEIINKLSDSKNEDAIIDLLDKLVVDGKVYIDINSLLYYRLWRIASIRKLGINQLLEMWGYDRTYFNQMQLSKSAIDWHDYESDDSISFIQNLLNELEKLQSKFNRTQSIKMKIARNRLLVKKLKILYNYHCQCCPDQNGFSSPIIEMSDGIPYVELHHIKPLAQLELSDADESNNMLDKYDNAIILCSHHHKYVHHYHGGDFNKIDVVDNQLCLKSERGDILPINTNLHLKKTT